MLAKEHMLQRWEQQQISVNGVNLHVVQAGPVEGPLVMLLHGFPVAGAELTDALGFPAA